MSTSAGDRTGDTQGSSEPEDRAFGRLPLLISEREYGTGGAHTTCFAYAIATWCFLTGGYAAQLVGAVDGMVCLLAGNVIGVFLTTMPLALGCQRYGIEQIDFCKPAFGQRGSKVLLVFYLINMIGWSGLILVMFGNGIRNIVEAFGYQPGSWVVGAGVALGLWLSYIVATRGVHLLNISNSIVTPGIGLLIAFMFYSLFSDYGWETIAAAPALDPSPTPGLNYLLAVELGIASGISWWGGVGFLARNTRKSRDSVYPEIVQLGLSGGIACCIGLFSALVVQSEDPTEWMVPIGGLFMGVLALLFVAVANITSTAVSLFASGLALRHIPALRDRPWWQLMVLLVIPCVPFIFWPSELYDLGDAFLAYNGTMYAPISGILFMDYFWLRKQRLSLWSIFEDAPSGDYYFSRGFNWVALGSLLLGQATYLFLYNPLTGATHDWFQWAPASLAAFAVPALTYGLAMRLLPGAAGPAEPASVMEPSETGRRRLIQPNI